MGERKGGAVLGLPHPTMDRGGEGKLKHLAVENKLTEFTRDLAVITEKHNARLLQEVKALGVNLSKIYSEKDVLLDCSLFSQIQS